VRERCGCSCHQHDTRHSNNHCVCITITASGHDHDDRHDRDDYYDHDCDHDGSAGGRGRPGRTVGTSRGRLPSSVPIQPTDLSASNPSDSWAGQRRDLYLPYLFMRANPGDNGTRPVVGPFWESPDIFILSGTDPSAAPAVPTQLGQTAQAGVPNTVYAHVWNFGQSSAPQVVVDFFWCNPSLGIGPQSAHMIGQSVISLGARGSGQSHAVVKCPQPWTPTFVNGGHECLLVRAWDYTSDALGTPPWDASINRHVAQRNIHVVPPGSGPAGQLLLTVGPLFGAPAQVNVERIAPAAMPWLQLHTGVRGQFPAQAMPTGTIQLSLPGPIGGGTSAGGIATTQHVTGDDQQIGFTTSDNPPAAGEAHVYRVSASQNGQTFGGYTVVLLG
jgi:hypothetical protein